MKLNKSSEQQESINITQIVVDLSNEIYDDEIWVKQEMWKVAEVTYSYVQPLDEDKNELANINTTLFSSLGNLDIRNIENLTCEQRNKEIKAAYELVTVKLEEKKSHIESIFPQLEKLMIQGNKVEKMQLEIFQGSLEEKLLFIEYGLNGLKYEGQKAGLKIDISKEEELAIDKRQSKIDDIIFDGAIKNHPEEVIKCYEYIHNKYLSVRNNLSDNEKEKLEGYINKIFVLLPKDYKYTPPLKLVNQVSKFETREISQKNYIKGFNLAIEGHPGLNYNADVSSTAKSISDGPDGFVVPDTGNFATFTVANMMRLNSHENEIHNISDHNSQQLIGKIRGAGSIIKDEGVAMLMEIFLKYGNQLFTQDAESGKCIIDIKKIPIKGTFVRGLMGELIQDNNELLDCFEIFEMIDKDTNEPRSRLDRLRRSNNTQTQKKDTSYMRGLFKVIELVNEYILSDGKKGLSFEDLMLGKVGFHEIYKLKEIKKHKEEQKQDIDIINPLFLSDAVYYGYEQQLEGKKITGKGFFHYLKDKYSIFSFSEQQILSQSYTTKKNVLAILELLYEEEGCMYNDKLVHRAMSDLTGKRKEVIEKLAA